MNLYDMIKNESLKLNQIFYGRGDNWIDILRISKITKNNFCVLQLIDCKDYVADSEYGPFQINQLVLGWKNYKLIDEGELNELKGELL